MGRIMARLVSQKEQKSRSRYEKYVANMKRKGRKSHKTALTYYEWKKSTPRTKTVVYGKSVS